MMTQINRVNKFQKEKHSTQRRKAGENTQSFFFAGLLRLCVFVCFFCLCNCGPSEIKPVDIYPEDMCSHCRMAISDQAFASEIITTSGEVYKFDDLGCMESFKKKSGDLKIAATFVKDFETKNWLLYERSTIVQTGIKTPMGSGKLALADSSRAQEILEQFPLNEN
ncbi:MAG: nitrous oxide reductase accessory protein NosL [candidate division KSB1 bacterium]|nr:nitrous oxide reductase accessory protein NosL [candidate division KSB1 bacterium]MDZ7303076.1 nitrous oxide reductase accessory protein NosL [candidate division KSB1 bacterium]